MRRGHRPKYGRLGHAELLAEGEEVGGGVHSYSSRVFVARTTAVASLILASWTSRGPRAAPGRPLLIVV